MVKDIALKSRPISEILIEDLADAYALPNFLPFLWQKRFVCLTIFYVPIKKTEIFNIYKKTQTTHI